MLKRIAVALLMGMVGVGVAQRAGVKSGTVTVQVLAINDLHGNLEPPDGANGMVNKVPAGGAEYLATHLKQAELQNPNSIVVGAGDLMGASPLLSGLFADAPTIEAVNAMGMSVTSIGNHELDHGPVELTRRLAGGCPLKEPKCGVAERYERAKYEYLAANVRRTEAVAGGAVGSTLYPATAVRVVGGVKIGFIGETLEESPTVIAAASIKGLKFLEESQVANEAAARLERQGVHTIVLLIHQGGGQRVERDVVADPNGCANFQGEIAGIAEKLSPVIKVVISGHTHQFYNCQIAGHTVTSAGSYGRMFTRVSLTIDRRTDRLEAVAATNEVVTRDVAKDPAQTAILERFRPGAQKIENQPEGSILETFTRRGNAAGESTLGDLVADAQLASAAVPEHGGAMVAFMNSGGLRADLVVPAGAAVPHEVSYGDLYAVQPFANQVTVVTMTGGGLRRLLESQFRPDGGLSLLQVSAGFSYKYKLHAEAGQHVVEGSMMLNGKPVAAEDVLRVEASDFLVGGGDGKTVFKEGKDQVIGPVDVDALVAYFHGHSPVAASRQDRILRVD